MSDRMKRQAADNRSAAKDLRNRGKADAAQRLEARADKLESGHVTDVTEPVSRLISWGFGRR
ncbi:hypothetical protein [Streptomyces sp. NPDC058268]|uniref:hypothetical protein n=1 Tax=Streptomyces sp. NPDC058268 TaxID=3346413 RepID=UPI0036E52F18